MEFRTYRRARTWVCLLATALARWAAAAEPNLPPQEFHVQQGDATRTLTDFSRQAHLQLLFDYNVVKGHATPPLDGTYTPGDALRRLLASTDLEFDFVNERTLAVMQRPNPAEAKAAPAEAKAESPPPPPPKNPAPPTAPSAPVDVVRITGTYVHDEPPVGEEIITSTRADIEATGSATPADFLRTLPQAFGGGPNQDTHIGQEAMTNSGLGVGVNLRGLGARATLVLIDGRRIAPSGTEGEFVDVENIPLSAIERIDILPDSASATYGADAVGGVVNFVLREKLDGGETIARAGTGTQGDLQEYLFAQTLGKTWDGGHAMINFELYDRSALPAADRAYATSDLRPFGGGNWDTNFTNPGNIISPATGQTYAIPTGQNGTHLTSADLIPGTENLQNQYLGAQIIPHQERWTLYTNGRQTLTDHASLFASALAGHREASETNGGIATEIMVPRSNPFYVNPSGNGPVLVGYNFGKDLGANDTHVGIDTLNTTLGVDIDAGAAWIVRAYGSYVREKQNEVVAGEINPTALTAALADANPLTAFNPFGDGSNTSGATLDKIRTTYPVWLDSQLKTADITADGPIGHALGIPLKLATGADWRDQTFYTTSISAPTTNVAANLRRKVFSAFGELVAPILTEQDAVPGIRRLELSAAARYENYTGYGSTTSPKYSLLWSPWHGLAVRGTWSRAMRPPTLVDLDLSRNVSGVLPFLDPTAPRGMTTALAWSGGNPDVRPERAKSWTAGLDFAPAWMTGLSVGLTYLKTVFTDRIQSTLYASDMLSNPIYASLITRNPSAAEIAYVCTQSIFQQGGAANCTNFPFGAILDLRIRNVALLTTDGVDFNGAYEHPVSRGELKFALGGTWLRHFSAAQTPDAPLIALLNTQNQPNNLRLRGSVGWHYRGWGSQIAANFTNSYTDISSSPPRKVDAWTTIDLQLLYDFPDDAGSWLQGMRIQLNARNLFNADPPFLNNKVRFIGYDQENADPYGRQLSLQLRKLW